MLVTEEEPGPTMREFGVSATPSFLLYSAEGSLVARANDLRELLGTG